MQGCAKDFTEDFTKVLNMICVKSLHLDTSVKEKIIHES